MGELDLPGLKAPGARILRSRLDGTRLAGARLRSLRLVDAQFADADLSNVDLGGGRAEPRALRALSDDRLQGAPRLKAEEVAFVRCKLDLASFRGAKLREVTFEDCVLDDADLSGGRDPRVALRALRPAAGADRRRCGSRASTCAARELEPDGDVTALRGAIDRPAPARRARAAARARARDRRPRREDDLRSPGAGATARSNASCARVHVEHVGDVRRQQRLGAAQIHSRGRPATPRGHRRRR